MLKRLGLAVVSAAVFGAALAAGPAAPAVAVGASPVAEPVAAVMASPAAEPAVAVVSVRSAAVTTVDGASVLADRVCTDSFWGGRFYCKYETLTWYFADGSVQFFVIGTDYAVWTRWLTPTGQMSSWRSLGGKIWTGGDASSWTICQYPLRTVVTLNIIGTDKAWWWSSRAATGRWSEWARGVKCFV